MDKPLDPMHGVNSPIPPPVPPSKHIALHLLSKVLDDETIFNLEESNSASENFLPLSVDPTLRYGKFKFLLELCPFHRLTLPAPGRFLSMSQIVWR